MTLFILLPAYNEVLSLPPLLESIEQVAAESEHDHRVIVCDDGSADGTAELLASYDGSLSLEVITHKINRGLGETVRDLFERAAELAGPGDVIVRMDCDYTHDPRIIEAMLGEIAAGADVVIASRFQHGGGQLGVSRYRAFVSYCANLFMKLFFPIAGLREYSCGFRAYRAEVIQDAVAFFANDFIQLRGLGFTCTLEKLIKLKIRGWRFAEVPFVLRYDQKVSDSKMISSVTTLGYMVMLVVHYWPFGGWLRSYAEQTRRQRASLR